MRYLLIILASALFLSSSGQTTPLPERGAAITDPQTLRELDRGPFGLARMLSASSSEPLTDSALFALPSVAPIRKSLDDEFDYGQQSTSSAEACRRSRWLPTSTPGDPTHWR